MDDRVAVGILRNGLVMSLEKSGNSSCTGGATYSLRKELTLAERVLALSAFYRVFHLFLIIM